MSSLQSFMFTFVDHDDTVSHAAAIRPWSPCKVSPSPLSSPPPLPLALLLSLLPSSLFHRNKTKRSNILIQVACPVILTLSGVGVPPQNQADSYKYMKKSKSKKGRIPLPLPPPLPSPPPHLHHVIHYMFTEEWLFGMKDMWVLAPERDGAHNWYLPLSLFYFSPHEVTFIFILSLFFFFFLLITCREGTGHQTAIAALHALEAITRGSQYHSDTHRLIYAGHSRYYSLSLFFTLLFVPPPMSFSSSPLASPFILYYYHLLLFCISKLIFSIRGGHGSWMLATRILLHHFLIS